MNRFSFIKVAAALGVAATGFTAPALAQSVPTIPSVTDAMGALKTGGSTVTNYSVNNDGSQGAATGMTATEASGGKVGTFSANSAVGDSQRFAVGTATNFGINASSSSTAEYAVNSQANLGLSGSSFSQNIGNSGGSLSQSAQDSQRDQYVYNSVESEIGSSSQSSFEREQANGSNRYGYSWWSPTMSYSDLTVTQKQEYETDYQLEKTSISTTATSNYNSSSSVREAANGTISGSFKATSGTDANGNTVDNNEVTVKGLGNSANLKAASGSNFDVNVQARVPGTIPDSNSATASGSAGANMSTTSSADASVTSFSSLFIQSF